MIIGLNEISAMLRGAILQIREHHELLSRLDSMGGDGDHGTTMLRVIAALEKALASAASRDPRSLLKDAGWAVMGVDGGATGPLFGSFLMGMSEAAGDAGLDAAGLAALFRAGLARLQRQTKALPGDKTLIDAFVPAVEAIEAAALAGGDVESLLKAGAAAAAAGAEATTGMQARFGRAKNVKEKSIGYPDAGATSASLIFKGFLEGVMANA